MRHNPALLDLAPLSFAIALGFPNSWAIRPSTKPTQLEPNTMPDFKTLLSKPMDSVTRPKLWPMGTYNGVVKSYELGESKQKKTPFVRFALAVTGAGDDIEPELLEGINLASRQFPLDFYITPDAEFRLKEFIESLGIPTAGRTFSETLPETAGHEVIMSITHRPIPDSDPQDFYVECRKAVGAA